MPEQSAFTGQLMSAERVLDVRPQLPGRPRPARVTAVPAGRAVPGILLLSRSCDAELDFLRGLLGRAGIHSVRLNADELESITLLIDPLSGVVQIDGCQLMPTVAWFRHFSARAIELSGQAAQRMFHRDSWQSTVEQLTLISATRLGAERPALLAQLSAARRHGVAVPRTIVTNHPARDGGVLRSERLVVKAMHRHFVEAAPGRLNGIFPVIVGREDLPTVCPPVIVQEYVEHETELRVYYVSGTVHAFEVRKGSPPDLWALPGRVAVRHMATPPRVAAAARLLAWEMSLRYAAFDFLVRADEPVFLEVNPDGDWLWAEHQAGVAPVTAAVAGLLAATHRRVLRGSGVPGGGSGAFDLLSFLSG